MAEKITLTRTEWEEMRDRLTSIEVKLTNHIHHLDNHIKFIYWVLPLVIGIISIGIKIIWR